mgnify:CR=1 FL=1
MVGGRQDSTSEYVDTVLTVFFCSVVEKKRDYIQDKFIFIFLRISMEALAIPIWIWMRHCIQDIEVSDE